LMARNEIASADVVIVGGGLMGCAAALYLARGGLDVVVLERRKLNQEASGTNAGSLHLQIYVHPTFADDYVEQIRSTVPLLREAAVGWAEVEAELDADCGVRLGGGLWVAETADEMELIEAKVRVENDMGVMSEVVSRAEMHDFAPYLGESIIGGSRLHGEGFANPLLVTGAYARAAEAVGARFITDRTAIHDVAAWLTKNGWKVVMSELGYLPKNNVELDAPQREAVGEFLQALDDHEDVHRIWAALA
jgi:sarcosine oxidase subunit beta